MMPVLLKIYSSRDFLPKPTVHHELLQPFWGEGQEPPDYTGLFRLDKYSKLANSLFKIVDDPNEADVAVLPTDWKRYKKHHEEKLAFKFCDNAAKAKLKVIVFYHTDSEDTLPIPNAIVLRTSLSGKRRSINEYSLPAFTGDMLKYYNDAKIEVRSWKNKPTIGFCGTAKETKWRSAMVKLVKAGLSREETRKFDAGTFRLNILRQVSSSKELNPNFLIRDSYFGGSKIAGKFDTDKLLAVRSEYYHNMIKSDYILCMRGVGNFSHRFYETLNCGRIPIFINTDSVLPFDSLINYKDSFVWVEAEDLKFINEIILDYHNALSKDQFIENQFKCRRIWEDFLSVDGFFSNLYRFIES